MQPVWSRLQGRIHGNLQHSEAVHRNRLMVGNHHFPIEREIDHLISVLKDFEPATGAS